MEENVGQAWSDNPPAMSGADELLLLGILVPGLLPEDAALAGGAEGTTTLYRAVTQTELESINANGGAFLPSPSGLPKYFSTTAEGASSYARQIYGTGLYEGPYTIVQSSFPTNISTEIFVDRGIPTVTIQNQSLPSLSPARPLNYTPIPPHLP